MASIDTQCDGYSFNPIADVQSTENLGSANKEHAPRRRLSIK